ncbi:energy transducer TonB [Mangrovimicrobium sediminis]|uniref:Protein TonB n=1 Tax=Mangrovimicrobium sediminis TaxID=2562682 RepID=A0A4Z0M9U1_9GAMM|nr:energy transducer TonB [Haliea sp. SAOS-164]TGD76160.1 energy transducer TonB [Haliea sp. SAOS-164]
MNDPIIEQRRGAGAAFGLLVGAGVGAAGALALALFMYTLINASEMRLNDGDHIQMLDFVRLKREEAAQRKDRKPERPQQEKPPEIPPDMNQDSSSSGETLAVTAPSGGGPGDLDIGRGGLGLGTGDGEYLPIVKVAPVYPRRAQQRGLSGECMVRYTVTTAGTVKDVEVLEDRCTDPVFYKASVEAARRFKYKPRVIDGVAIEVIGVYNNFTYELDGQRN